MLNLILILLLLHFIFHFINKRSNNILYCGLFGFIGDKGKNVNWGMLNLLGVFNDPRGGDACGLFFNNNREVGTLTDSYYAKFIKEKSFEFFTQTPLVLGHTRKASIGNKTEAHAQPVIFKSKDEVSQHLFKTNKKLQEIRDSYPKKRIPKNDILFAGTHNGTLRNYEELGKDFKISDIDDKTDSMVLFEIIFKHGPAVLTEYIGTAAIMYWDIRTPNGIYVFRGESKYSSSYASVSEERPLHYVHREEGIYFSSEEEPLKVLGKNPLEIEENKVTFFEHGKINKNIVYNIDRSKKSQIITSSSSYWENDNCNTRNQHSSHNQTNLFNNTVFGGSKSIPVYDNHLK